MHHRRARPRATSRAERRARRPARRAARPRRAARQQVALERARSPAARRGGSGRWRGPLIPGSSPPRAASPRAAPAAAKPSSSASARCSQSGTVGPGIPPGTAKAPAAPGGRASASPRQSACSARTSAAAATNRPRPTRQDQPGRARRGLRHQQRIPTRRSRRAACPRAPAMPSASPQPSAGWLAASPPISAIFWLPLMLHRARRRRRRPPIFTSAWPSRCRMPARFATAPPRPKAKVAMPTCSIELQAKSRRASRRRQQREGREQQRDQPEAHQEGAGGERRRMRADDRLGAQDRDQRGVQQQPRQHRGDRQRALGLGVRQPGMQRHQPRLGAVADQQEDEGEREHARVAALGDRAQRRPGQARIAAARRPAARRDTAGWCRTAPARCRRRRG